MSDKSDNTEIAILKSRDDENDIESIEEEFKEALSVPFLLTDHVTELEITINGKRTIQNIPIFHTLIMNKNYNFILNHIEHLPVSVNYSQDYEKWKPLPMSYTQYCDELKNIEANYPDVYNEHIVNTLLTLIKELYLEGWVYHFYSFEENILTPFLELAKQNPEKYDLSDFEQFKNNTDIIAKLEHEKTGELLFIFGAVQLN